MDLKRIFKYSYGDRYTAMVYTVQCTSLHKIRFLSTLCVSNAAFLVLGFFSNWNILKIGILF
jgi:hypothetical protein